ncbi:MAG: hypothetical protein NTU76_00880 [Candidatus Taylorbacteria bacterium]|nr:hypothetical protein [Candidatus Taylorbacteria bacterium]
MNLQIIKAKPNPSGKDRIKNFAPQYQLAGEWVDIKNFSNQPMNLTHVKLYHWAYKLPKPDWEIVTGFQGTLPAGKVVRVHTGQKTSLSEIRPEDLLGADFHIFSGKGYLWNNDKEDKPMLWDTNIKEYIDKTSYDAYPLEGKILNRISNKLI